MAEPIDDALRQSVLFRRLKPDDRQRVTAVATVRVFEKGATLFSEGDGSDLVFVHGEIHGLEYWEHQIPEFARDHRCFAYNRRGHAKTGATNYGFSLVNQTRDLAQLIDHFGMERPVIIAVAFGTTSRSWGRMWT